MFGMGMSEVMLILALALIIIGPRKLPELAQSLGNGLAEFKRATQEFREPLSRPTTTKAPGDLSAKKQQTNNNLEKRSAHVDG